MTGDIKLQNWRASPRQ